jgi:hypothetical protein
MIWARMLERGATLGGRVIFLPHLWSGVCTVEMGGRGPLTQIHANSFHRTGALNTADPRPGDVFVTILPCWHVFERSTEYWMLPEPCPRDAGHQRLCNKKQLC